MLVGRWLSAFAGAPTSPPPPRLPRAVDTHDEPHQQMGKRLEGVGDHGRPLQLVSGGAGLVRPGIASSRSISASAIGGLEVGGGRREHPAEADDFCIDVHPTTTADYGRFVESTGHPAPRHWTDARPPPGLDDHPVVYVTWRDAGPYAQGAGRAMPTSPFHRSAPSSFSDASADMADDDTGFRCVAAPDALDAECHPAAMPPS